MRGCIAIAALALLVASSRSASAAGASCQIVNVTPLVLPVYHAGQPQPADGVGELAVSCGATTMVQITLTRGLSGRPGSRRMMGVGGSVAYELFLDAARTSSWGDGTAGSQAFAGVVGMGQTLRLPVYGRIFGYQAAPAGVYADTIEVIVVF